MNASKNPSPAISVVMPVYNCEKYVSFAIESILKQSFADFEFIIIDDGSTDNSVNIINQFRDPRINFICNEVNRGNYPLRNQGMGIARGKYICVMDADDISEPERFGIQYQFLENNPDVGICGTFIRNIPSDLVPRFITDHDHLKAAFLSNNFCSHPSLCIRREIIEKHALKYNEDYYYSADFDLCVHALRFTKIQNIPVVLLRYRRHRDQISCAKCRDQEKFADMIRINQLIESLQFRLEEIPVLLHLRLMKKQPILEKYKPQAEQWVDKILEKNKIINYFDQKILEQFLTAYLRLSIDSFQIRAGHSFRAHQL